MNLLDYEPPQPRSPRTFRLAAAYAGGVVIGLFFTLLLDDYLHRRWIGHSSDFVGIALSLGSVAVSLPLSAHMCLTRRFGPLVALALGLVSCPLGLLIIVAASMLR
jgi:hypothetical protein